MNELLFSRIINNQTTAILLVDDALRIEYMNNAAENMLSTSKQRVHGHHVSDLFAENGTSVEEFSNAIESGQSYTKRKSQISFLNGEISTVDYTVSPISGDNRSYLVVEIVPRDRWLRIYREENLIEQQDTSQTLIRGLAHEIKNPLGGIRGAAQLLQRELPNPEFEEYTRIIIDEADRLKDLVNQMLGPYKQVEFDDVNVHEVLEHVRNLVSTESGGKIEFIRDYDPSIPAVTGNRSLLIQALLNVLRNAMQAVLENDGADNPRISLVTRSARQITLGSQRHRIICRIDIIDNGPGIPEQMQETIFYPMVSGRAAGTGLGLTIAQRIINQHKGLIEFDSNPGCTCFTLFIPVQTGEINHESSD